jgi:uncharacterized protein (TIGR02271 family)
VNQVAKTIVGLFDTAEGAERAVRDLMSRGFSRDDISVVANATVGGYGTTASADVDGDGNDDKAAEAAGGGAVGGTLLGGGLGLLVGLGLLAIPGIGPVAAAGTLAAVLGSTALGAGIGAAAGGLIGALVGSGVPEDEAQVYAEGVRRGGTLVTINSSDEMADEAVAALEASDPVNVEQREADLRTAGWERFDPTAEPLSAEELQVERAAFSAERASTTERPASVASDADAVLPVIEEELSVGKREVQRGRVRVHTRVVETPVEEQVRLREERVNVERRPVDREVTAADANLFKEQQFELRETAEQVVVNKEARVVEEVVIDKDVTEHTETISDTVRRTDVEVERTAGGVANEEARGMAMADYSTYADDFRSYYTTSYGTSGRSYDEYDPAFRYGYTLADDRRYQGQDWASFEADARNEWERERPGTWEQFKDSVRYAWDKARGSR